MPKVSVVVLTFNSERTIGACLKSLRRQSFRDFEILVMDGGSTDKTLEIAKRYGAKIYPDSGPLATARNRGIDESRSEFVAFIDSDEIADRKWLERLWKCSEGAEIVLGNVGTWNKEKTVAYVVGLRVLLDYASKQKQISAGSLYSFATWNLLLRKSLLNRVGKFDPAQPSEDGDLSYRAMKKGARLSYAPGARTFHKHPDSLVRYYKIQRMYARIHQVLAKKYGIYRLYNVQVVFHSFSPLPFIEIIRAKNGDIRRVLIPVICWVRGLAYLLSYFDKL